MDHIISQGRLRIAAVRHLNGCTLWVRGANFTEIENWFCSYEGREHWLGKQDNEDGERGPDFLKAGYSPRATGYP
jgi:hypothetical protein